MLKLNAKLILSVWIYLGWFGCVYFGKIGWGLTTLIFPLVSFGLAHLNFCFHQKMAFRLLVLFFAGIFFDSFSVYFNLIELVPKADVGFLPLWMISIWLLFVSSLPLLQTFFQKKYFLAALLGLVFGPLSYRAGSQFGTLLLNGLPALFVYAIFWTIYMPSAVFWLGRKEI